MKYAPKIVTVLALASGIIVLSAGVMAPAYAARPMDGGSSSPDTPASASSPSTSPSPSPSPTSSGSLSQDSQCAGGTTTCIDPPDKKLPEDKLDCDGDGVPDDGCTFGKKYLNSFIKLISGLAGLAVIMGVIIGGIQYSSSGGDPQKVAAAKLRIRNSIIALIVFFFLYALLRFLAPGIVGGS